mgnify:CR=1 FL=1
MMPSDLDQLRADFKTVWDYRRNAGHLSATEHREQYARARNEANSRKDDPDWVRRAAAEYRAEAAQIEKERARANQIAEEVRAARASKTSQRKSVVARKS